MRYSVYTIMGLLVSMLFQACRFETKELPGAVVSIDERVLTEKMLRDALPEGMSPADSSAFADAYIRRWAESQLLYEQAQKNLPDVERIDRLVERYRRELFIHEYKKQLLNEKLNVEISDELVQNYYRTHAHRYILSSPIIKGLFLKVSENSPQIGDLKKWYKVESANAVGNIEKYTLHNVVNYEYFYDRWVSFDEVMDNIPYPISDADEFLSTNKTIEVNRDGYWYLLNISDYLPSKANMPLDYARPQIVEQLKNSQRQKFWEEMNNELYNEAVRTRKIKFHSHNNH